MRDIFLEAESFQELGGWLMERLHGMKYAAMDFMAS